MGNQESFHDLPAADSQFHEPQNVPVEKVLRDYLVKVLKRRDDIDEDVEKIIDELEPHTEHLEYDTATEIVTKGEPSDGMYIILNGDADLLIPADEQRHEQEQCLSILGRHDVVGDVSLFFGIPSLHTVVVYKDMILLRTPANIVKESKLAQMVKEDYDLEDWLVQRKQMAIPQIEGIDSKAVIRRMVSRMYRQVQLFSSWTSKQIDLMVSMMPEPLLEVYPIDAMIAGCGDKPRALLLLIRGDVVCKDKFGEEILTLAVRRYPFCFGEEGLVDEDWSFPYTITTSSTCQLVRVQLEDIEATAQAWLENMPNQDIFKPWQTTCELWQSIKQARNEDLHRKYLAQLQVEFTYQKLRQSGVLPLHLYSTRAMYTIAMMGIAIEGEEGKPLDPSEEPSAIVILVLGKLGVPDTDRYKDFPEYWGPGSVIYCKNGTVDSQDLQVREAPCLAVKFMEEDLRRIQAKFYRKSSFV